MSNTTNTTSTSNTTNTTSKISKNNKQLAVTGRPFTGLVSVFIDNSNLDVEGKYSVGRLESAGDYHQRRRTYFLDALTIDYGHLLSTILNGRSISESPTIVGHRPDHTDNLWNYARGLGFEVTVHDLSDQGSSVYKGKKVSTLTIAAMNTMWTKDPGTFIIVAGNGDYEPVAREALKRRWKVETWFWKSGTSTDLKPKENESSKFYFSLDLYYKRFTYACGVKPQKDEEYEHPRNKYILEITDSEILKKWSNTLVVNCFNSLNLFKWWYWDEEYNSVFLYFGTRTHLKEADQWLRKNYPNIQFWEVKR